MKKLSVRMLFICAMTLCLMSCDREPENRLPIYGQHSTTEKEVDGKVIIDTVYHTIPNFSFINQDSGMLNQDFFDGKIYIANFFFTKCPTICPLMQRNILGIYEQYRNNGRVAFLSHSIDYKYDHPWVLKEYADRLGVDNDQWQFVNGQKNEIFDISKEYLVFTTEDEQAPGGYDHQGLFILVDPESRIRGAYDGTDTGQLNKLRNDLEILLKEYE